MMPGRLMPISVSWSGTVGEGHDLPGRETVGQEGGGMGGGTGGGGGRGEGRREEGRGRVGVAMLTDEDKGFLLGCCWCRSRSLR